MMFFSHTEDMAQLAHLDAFVRKQLSRVNFPEQQIPNIKKFIKSYHEIRYNLDKTIYIPNLDKFDQNDKASAIAALSNRTLVEILTWDIQRIDEEFSRLMSREVSDLEQDVGSPS
jgi:RNA-directed DNA polymerase